MDGDVLIVTRVSDSHSDRAARVRDDVNNFFVDDIDHCLFDVDLYFVADAIDVFIGLNDEQLMQHNIGCDIGVGHRAAGAWGVRMDPHFHYLFSSQCRPTANDSHFDQ